MDDLLKFVPEDKAEEFKTVAANYVKADVDAIKANTALFDKLVEGPIKTRETNLREKEFPELLKAEREKLIKELNPEETPEQKRIRELEEKLSEKDRREQAAMRRDELRKKYSDFSDIAAELNVLDDEKVESIIGRFKEFNQKIVDLEAQLKYGTKPPPAGGSGKTMTQAAFNAMSPKEQSAFMANGGSLAD